jgi:hypothetical protein
MNYKIDDKLYARGLISGTYVAGIPDSYKPHWYALKHRSDCGDTLDASELSFLKTVNAIASKRYAARRRARNYDFARVADKFCNPAKRI